MSLQPESPEYYAEGFRDFITLKPIQDKINISRSLILEILTARKIRLIDTLKSQSIGYPDRFYTVYFIEPSNETLKFFSDMFTETIIKGKAIRKIKCQS